MIIHDFDSRGNHRLRLSSAVGEWAGYTSVAHLQHGKFHYEATTDYFKERVVVIREVEHKVVMQQQHH